MSSLNLNRSKIYAFYLVEFLKKRCKKTWCNAHDAKMKCSGPNKTHDETRKPWKATEAPVLGRYNTPPLREDLVPRSRMAPEGKRKRKRNGKTKLLLTTNEWNQRTLRGWTNSRKEHNEGERSWKHSVRKEGQRTLRKPWGWRARYILKPLRLRKRNKKEPIQTALRMKRKGIE